MDQPLQKTPRKRSAAYVPALFFLFLYVAFFFSVCWYLSKSLMRGSGMSIQSGLMIPNAYAEIFIVLLQIVAGLFLAVICSRKNRALHFAGIGLFATANTLLLAYPAYIYISTLIGQQWLDKHNIKSNAITLMQFFAMLLLLAAAVSATVLAANGGFSKRKVTAFQKLWFLPGGLCALSVLLIILSCLPDLIAGTANGNTDALTYVILALLLVIPTLDCGVYFCVCRCLSAAGAADGEALSFPVGE